ncbi:hypothetical protein CTA2_10959 [Colletotrichum tanaceti]|nr:hypothetical protein CTA2_10959 [Colletotrichum tanaceti]
MLASRYQYKVLGQESLTHTEVDHMQRMYDFSTIGSSYGYKPRPLVLATREASMLDASLGGSVEVYQS